ncbi:MAG: hypothetical protein V3T95_01980 [Acidobacteriota bacterium]
MTTIVNGLETEYQGVLDCEILDATSPENRKKIQDYGFGNHGLVVFDAEKNVRKKFDGHLIEEAEIRQAVQEVLESS